MRTDGLRAVFEAEGPYVTVHLDVSRDSEEAEDRISAAWTSLRHQVDRWGLPPALVGELDRRLHENHHLAGTVRRTLVTAGGEVVLDDVQQGPNPLPEVVDHGELPELSSWMAVADRVVPFVLATVDRVGGHVAAYHALSAPEAAEERSVHGHDFHITKVAPGNWSQKQHQRTAENRWRDNASEVAAAVQSLVAQEAAVVFVAGEVRARAEVSKALATLDPNLADPREIRAGGSGDGASEEAMWAEIAQQLSVVVAEEDASLAARLDQAHGQGRGAAIGLDQTLEALTAGQVETCLVDPAALAEPVVRPEDVPGLPLPAAARAAERLPADRVVVAASVLTGARVRLLPSSMIQGESVAALLRWDASGDAPV